MYTSLKEIVTVSYFLESCSQQNNQEVALMNKHILNIYFWHTAVWKTKKKSLHYWGIFNSITSIQIHIKNNKTYKTLTTKKNIQNAE